MKKGYNKWMKYIHKTLNEKNNTKKEVYFGEIGQRTSKQIQDEINYLQELDKHISNRVRSTYKLSK